MHFCHEHWQGRGDNAKLTERVRRAAVNIKQARDATEEEVRRMEAGAEMTRRLIELERRVAVGATDLTDMERGIHARITAMGEQIVDELLAGLGDEPSWSSKVVGGICSQTCAHPTASAVAVALLALLVVSEILLVIFCGANLFRLVRWCCHRQQAPQQVQAPDYYQMQQL